jgi:hypothetical protein
VNRRGGGSVSTAPYGVAGAMILLSSALALVACQALGLPRSVGPTDANGSGGQPPTATVVDSVVASVAPSHSQRPVTSSPSEPASEADPHIAANTVGAYLDALTAGRYPAAWQLLAPSARSMWGSETEFATERAAFYSTAGPSLSISAPDNAASTLATWLPADFDGDRKRAYVIAVDHPQIQSNASREVLIAAPDPVGAWHVWIGR